MASAFHPGSASPDPQGMDVGRFCVAKGASLGDLLQANRRFSWICLVLMILSTVMQKGLMTLLVGFFVWNFFPTKNANLSLPSNMLMAYFTRIPTWTIPLTVSSRWPILNVICSRVNQPLEGYKRNGLANGKPWNFWGWWLSITKWAPASHKWSFNWVCQGPHFTPFIPFHPIYDWIRNAHRK